MSESARIVLVKPGDVLVLGNVSIPADSKQMEKVLTFFKDRFGLAEIVVFEDDIELAVQQPIERSDVHTVLQNDLCAKCGKVRGIRFDDGTVDWIARSQAPDCKHELPAEAS